MTIFPPLHILPLFIHLVSGKANTASQENISSKIGLILSFSLVLIWGARLPVIRIGRIAGQYAKPRSSSHETLGDGRKVLSFRCVPLVSCPRNRPLMHFFFFIFHHQQCVAAITLPSRKYTFSRTLHFVPLLVAEATMLTGTFSLLKTTSA